MLLHFIFLLGIFFPIEADTDISCLKDGIQKIGSRPSCSLGFGYFNVSGELLCVPCLCPPGEVMSLSCNNAVLHDVNTCEEIKCRACGVDYFERFGRCHLCQQECKLKKNEFETQSCSLTTNRICRCQHPFYRDILSHNCTRRCSPCRSNNTAERVQEGYCEDSTPENRCVDRGEPPRNQTGKPYTNIPTNFTTVPTNGSNISTTPQANYTDTVAESDGTDDWLVPLTSVLALVLICFVFWCCYKKCKVSKSSESLIPLVCEDRSQYVTMDIRDEQHVDESNAVNQESSFMRNDSGVISMEPQVCEPTISDLTPNHWKKFADLLETEHGCFYYVKLLYQLEKSTVEDVKINDTKKIIKELNDPGRFGIGKGLLDVINTQNSEWTLGKLTSLLRENDLVRNDMEVYLQNNNASNITVGSLVSEHTIHAKVHWDVIMFLTQEVPDYSWQGAAACFLNTASPQSPEYKEQSNQCERVISQLKVKCQQTRQDEDTLNALFRWLKVVKPKMKLSNLVVELRKVDINSVASQLEEIIKEIIKLLNPNNNECK